MRLGELRQPGHGVDETCARLDDGVPARVGQLRAYGNAIVPALAAVFIRAYQESVRNQR